MGGTWLHQIQGVGFKTEKTAKNMGIYGIAFSLCYLCMLLPLTTSSPQPIYGKLKDALSFGFNQINEIIQKVPAWPTEPVVENNYEAKGQMIKLDDTMQAYQTGSGSKMVVWAHDIFGLTGDKSGDRRTKEWADFLADNGYNVLIPDWFRGSNMVGFFGPITQAWLTSVTNWTNIQSDWENVIFPYIEKESPSSIGMVGTCWGSYPVVRLSMLDTISAGISMHPSHPTALASAGDDEKAVLELIKAPQLFLVEGDAGDSVKTGGLSEQVLGDKLTVVEFPDMSHGWTVGGDLDDPNVARDVMMAKYYVLEFLEKYLH